MDEEIQFILIDSVAGSRDDKVFLYQNVGTAHIQEVNFQDAEVLSAEERKKMDIAQVGFLTVNAMCNVMDILCTVEPIRWTPTGLLQVSIIWGCPLFGGFCLNIFVMSLYAPKRLLYNKKQLMVLLYMTIRVKRGKSHKTALSIVTVKKGNFAYGG